MSPYLIVYVILLFGIFVSAVVDKYIYLTDGAGVRISFDKMFFLIAFVFLGLLMAFRYGQGTDYYNYYDIYKSANIKLLFSQGLHGETGWKILNILFKSLGLTFEAFVFFVSVIEAVSINRFVNLYCKNYRCLALAMLFPTVILSYMFNLMRQGLVLSLFLGFMLPLLEKKRYLKFAIWTVAMGFIHMVSLVYLFLIPVRKYEGRIKVYKLEVASYTCAVLSFAFGVVNISNILGRFVPASIIYHAPVGYSYSSTLENVVLMVIMSVLYHHAANKEELRKYYVIFLCGSIFYFLTSWMTMLANRTFAYWKYVYVVFFLKYFLYNKNKWRQMALLFFIAFVSFMMVRNIAVSIGQGGYPESVNAFNYPYISVFDKKQAEYYRNFSVLVYP